AGPWGACPAAGGGATGASATFVSRRGGGRWRGTSRGRATGRRVARRRVGSRTCHGLRTNQIEDSCGVIGAREGGEIRPSLEVLRRRFGRPDRPETEGQTRAGQGPP